MGIIELKTILNIFSPSGWLRFESPSSQLKPPTVGLLEDPGSLLLSCTWEVEPRLPTRNPGHAQGAVHVFVIAAADVELEVQLIGIPSAAWMEGDVSPTSAWQRKPEFLCQRLATRRSQASPLRCIPTSSQRGEAPCLIFAAVTVSAFLLSL